MTPLLFAAALALSPAPASSAPPAAVDLAKPGLHMPGFHIVQPPSAIDCAARFAVQTAGSDAGQVKKLGELPPGVLEHAVLRSVGGCVVREIVSGGQIHYLPSSSPTIQSIEPVANRFKQQ